MIEILTNLLGECVESREWNHSTTGYGVYPDARGIVRAIFLVDKQPRLLLELTDDCYKNGGKKPGDLLTIELENVRIVKQCEKCEWPEWYSVPDLRKHERERHPVGTP